MTSTDALFVAIEAGDVDAVGRMIRDDPSLVNARDADGVSALMRARYRLDRGMTAAVLEGDPVLDVFEAAAFGEIDRLTELLDADPSRATGYAADGFTPLHLAAFFGQAAAATLLLARGADVDAPGRRWMIGTALHSATSANHVGIARILVDAGADPNARQSGGWTPLHGAAHNGNADLVMLLLDHGGDPAAVNDEGASVLAIAEERGDPATIELLRAALGA